METTDSIYFYGVKDKYAFMSNFYKCNFTDERNITFNCSEQYFMYEKCMLFDSGNKTLLDNILKETNPVQIKKYGRSVKNFDNKTWNACRYDVMYKSAKLKFEQNEDIKQKLIQTGNKILYEASKYDRIWGIGYFAMDAVKQPIKNYGQNLLGKILMEIRID